MKGEDTITCWGVFLLTSRVMNPSPPTEQPKEKLAKFIIQTQRQLPYPGLPVFAPGLLRNPDSVQESR